MSKRFVAIWVVVMLFLGAIDLMTTGMILAAGGVELNPSAAWIFGSLGSVGMLAFAFAKLLVIGTVILGIVWLPKTRWFRTMEPWGQEFSMIVLWVAAGFMLVLSAAAVIHNLIQLTT